MPISYLRLGAIIVRRWRVINRDARCGRNATGQLHTLPRRLRLIQRLYPINDGWWRHVYADLRGKNDIEISIYMSKAS